MILASNIEADEIKGGEMMGGQMGGGSPYNGLLEFWDAAMGVGLAGTNVVTWTGILGSGINSTWNQYSTLSPTFAPLHTTNNFPAIRFYNLVGGAGNAPRMRNNTLANYISGGANGGSNFTYLVLCCGQTNGTLAAVGFGWTSASNANASVVHLRANAGTDTSKTWSIGFNTNSNTLVTTRTGGLTTNVYSWIMVSASNGVFNVMENLLATRSTARDLTGTKLTLNSATLGGGCRTNDTFALPWYGAITCFGYWTNWQEGTTMTNNMNYFNNNYRDGVYKVY